VADVIERQQVILLYCGGERKAFEKILPALTVMGRKVLHTGELGTASVLKLLQII
jgi:3-hydroxyisobutyrate dehydrogenase